MSRLTQQKLAELVTDLYPLLIAKAEAGKTVRYQKLYKGRAFVGGVVGEITGREHAKGRPMLSAIVVRADTKMPGTGFWGFDWIPSHLNRKMWEEQGKVPSEEVRHERQQWWEQEKGKVFAYWRGAKATHVMWKHGSGLESEKHRALKEWCAYNPQALGLNEVIGTGRTEYIFEKTGDRADVLFELTGGRYAVLEVETDSPEPGAHQALKYRVLMCAQKDLGITSEKIVGGLVASQVPTHVRQFCDKYQLRWWKVSDGEPRQVISSSQ